MKFPTLSFWSHRDPGDAAGRIDRALNDRNHRLSVGLSVPPSFEMVQGAIVVSQGNGKHLRIQHVVGTSMPVPKPVIDGCLELVLGESSHTSDWRQLIADLADVQAAVVEDLKRQAGKYVDRVLAVSVCDPGLWHSDFDDRVSYTSLCDSTRLAELCGVSVIDAFPARDLAVNGNGRPLEPLPVWILFSDRNPKIASQSRCLITFGDRTHGYRLPASDGLDAEIPEIGVKSTIGFRFLELILGDHLECPLDKFVFETPNGESIAIPGLRQEWENAIFPFTSACGSSKTELSDITPRDHHKLSLELAGIGDVYLGKPQFHPSQIAATAVAWVTETIAESIQQDTGPAIDQLFVASPGCFAGCFEEKVIDELGEQFPATTVAGSQELGLEACTIDSVAAAVLGLFHIDQMAANIPWITGADSQRILGRLTPGRPSNWRQLIRSMADFHPAPMKLKDAI